MTFLIQITPPPTPPPPPPGLPIDSGIWILMLAAIIYGSLLVWRKNRKVKKERINENDNTNYTILATDKSNPQKELLELISAIFRKIKRCFFFVLISIVTIQATYSQATTDQLKIIDISETTNTWAIGGGVSNFIMHGDLRSLGTGELGNFWNFGGYLYVDKMFNPILGLEFKLNYNEVSGGAQYFSDVYDVLYIDSTITDDLFFEGRAFGAELNMILSFSNIFKRDARRWNVAGYLGVGYHLYNSKLFSNNPNGANTLLVDFGNNPQRNNPREASSIFLSLQMGVKYRLTKRIDLEVRPSWYFNHEDHLDAAISDKQIWENFFVTHLGLTVKLGNKEAYTIWGDAKTNQEIESFQIIDTDGDGVMDPLDIENDTPKGVKVYGNGQAVDSDNDGLPDYKDDCPLKPGPLENKGCPSLKDSDDDGLFDHEDLCPTQPGPIENKGCPKLKENKQITVFKFISDLAANVYFETGKWTLTQDSKEVLDKIAKYMEEVPDVKFIVEGHTDNRDRDKFNLLLSQKRAHAVVKYLKKSGVKESQLEYKGYGETRPKYSNETPQGRQLNRRVEIHPERVFESEILENDEDVVVHIVKKNETLYSIAKKYFTSTETLKSLNGLKDDTLKVGQQLMIKK